MTNKIPNKILNLRNNETPFMVVEHGSDSAYFYWVSKNGMYGPQVQAIIYREHTYAGEYKTNGCGYDKEQSAQEEVLPQIGVEIKSGCVLNTKYHIGGNFWRVE